MKTIWILGAGASISCSDRKYPTIDTFFRKAKEQGIISETIRKIKEEYKDVADFVYDNFGYNILRKDAKIDIEELMTILEISNSKITTGKTIVLYDKLISIIQKTFFKLQINLPQDSEYNMLVKNLSQEDTILTFNWDILLDNAFGRILVIKNKEDKKKNQYLNLIETVITRNTWAKLNVRDPYLKYNSERGYYLKLHGSVDWQYCNNEKCVGFGKVFALEHFKEKHFCSECHKELNILIIPPVLNKQYEKYPIISNMWNIAAKEIEYSDRIIIWGYSLPPTDFYANWLLRQSKQGIEKVVIINPDVKRGQKQITYNYIFIRRLLGTIRHKVKTVELYEYFKDYQDGKQLYQKHSLEDNKWL